MAVTSCDPNALALASRCLVCLPTGFKPTVNVSLLNSISGFNGTAQSIIDASTAFEKFQGSSLAAEVYLLSLIAGLSTETISQLMTDSRCFQCGQQGELDDALTYLYAVQAGGSTDPNDLSAGARTFQSIFGKEWRASLFLTCQWSLSVGVIASCDPDSLENASRCFLNCLSDYSLKALRVYLLCFININGLGGGNIVPPGSVCAAGTFTLTVKPNQTYDITWGVETQVNICGTIYPSTGAGTVTTVFTGPCATMVFSCAGGATITSRVSPSSKTPVPSGFTFTLNGAGNAVASWDSPPGFVTATELWTSSDNITFVLASTTASPGTSSTVAGPAVGTTLYGKIRWLAPSGFPPQGAFTGVLSVAGNVSDWVQRVLANGGAAPSQNTIDAVSTFETAIASIRSKFKTLNFFAPDNNLAAMTPFIVGNGIDPYFPTDPVNNAYTADINGCALTINGAPGWLKCGVIPSAVFNLGNAGCTIYCSVNTSDAAIQTCGCDDTGQTRVYWIYTNQGGNYFAFAFGFDASGLNPIALPANPTLGYFSQNRVAANDHRLFFANSVNPHAQLGATVANANVTNPPAVEFGLFGVNRSGAPAGFGTVNKKFSLFALHDGFTLAESAILYNAIQALRTSFGGGFS